MMSRRKRIGGLEHDAVARRERRGELPHGHEDREVPRDDLADDAERLVEVVRDGVLVDLGDRPLLRTDRAREVAEVVDRERDVGGERLADGLAVLPRLGDGDPLEVLLHAVGDLVEDVGALGRARAAPRPGGAVRGVERALDVVGGAPRDLGEGPARHGARVLEVLPAGRRDVLAADPVVVPGLVLGDRPVRAGGCVDRHRLPPRSADSQCWSSPRPGEVAVGRGASDGGARPGASSRRAADGRRRRVAGPLQRVAPARAQASSSSSRSRWARARSHSGLPWSATRCSRVHAA